MYWLYEFCFASRTIKASIDNVNELRIALNTWVGPVEFFSLNQKQVF